MFIYKIYKRLTGLNPEDVKKLVYVQKYLDKTNSSRTSYNEYLKEHFNAQ